MPEVTFGPEPLHQWVYRCRVMRIIDADSLAVAVDLGFNLSAIITVRLLGVDAPELRGLESDAGMRARAWVREWVGVVGVAGGDTPWPLLIRTVKDSKDKYGRYLCQIHRPGDPVSLNQALLDAQMATVYQP